MASHCRCTRTYAIYFGGILRIHGSIDWRQLKNRTANPQTQPCPAAATWSHQQPALIGRRPVFLLIYFQPWHLAATPNAHPLKIRCWRLSVLWAEPFREPGPQSAAFLDGMAAAHRPIRRPDGSPCTLSSLPVERVLSLFREETKRTSSL